MARLHDADGFHAWLWRYTHGAGRTWSEIMGSLVGVGAAFERDEPPELSNEQERMLAHYEALLEQLYQEGRVEFDWNHQSDFRYQLITPVGERRVAR